MMGDVGGVGGNVSALLSALMSTDNATRQQAEVKKDPCYATFGDGATCEKERERKQGEKERRDGPR